jgi:hypothetical protein
MRPISRRQFKKGGKVVAVHGEHAKHHAGRKPRKSGGKALTADSLVNRDVREANKERDGSKHVGGFKRGGSPRGEMMDCPECGGYGHSTDVEEGSNVPYPCYSCGTSGRVPYEPKGMSRRSVQKRDRREAAYKEASRRSYPFKRQSEVSNPDDDIPFKRGGRIHKEDGGSFVPTSRMAFQTGPSQMSKAAGLKRGGRTHKARGGNLSVEDADTGRPSLRLLSKHTGSQGHTTKVYKDRDTGEHRVKYFKPDGTYMPKADSYHYDDRDDAMNTAKHMAEKGYKRGGVAKHDDTAEDTKLIKKLVKPSAMKDHPASCRCAKCGGGRAGHKHGGAPKHHKKHRADGGINWSANETKPNLPPELHSPVGEDKSARLPPVLPKKPTLPPKKKRGGSLSVSDGALEGTRPTGGRLARKHGGAAKGKTNINIIIGTGHKAPGAAAGMLPPVGPDGGPVGLRQGLGAGAGAPPAGMLPMPPGAPAPMGGPAPMPPMGRKRGGRVKYPIDHASGGGLGRLEKIKAYGKEAGPVVKHTQK